MRSNRGMGVEMSAMITGHHCVADSITSTATAVIAALALWQIKLLRGQFRTNFEDGLTQQYRRIMEDIPTTIWLGKSLSALSEEPRGRCRDAIYRYIDLCQDQIFLHGIGRINPKTWKEWNDGILSNMRLPAFAEVWKEVSEGRPDDFAELRNLLRGLPAQSRAGLFARLWRCLTS